jgi:hypothetical protein
VAIEQPLKSQVGPVLGTYLNINKLVCYGANSATLMAAYIVLYWRQQLLWWQFQKYVKIIWFAMGANLCWQFIFVVLF